MVYFGTGSILSMDDALNDGKDNSGKYTKKQAVYGIWVDTSDLTTLKDWPALRQQRPANPITRSSHLQHHTKCTLCTQRKSGQLPLSFSFGQLHSA